MSKFENKVDYNLSESGVHPLTVDEFLDYNPGIMDKIKSTLINYPYEDLAPALVVLGNTFEAPVEAR